MLYHGVSRPIQRLDARTLSQHNEDAFEGMFGPFIRSDLSWHRDITGSANMLVDQLVYVK